MVKILDEWFEMPKLNGIGNQKVRLEKEEQGDNMGYTIEQVKEIVESEGLGYTVLEYMSSESIEDEILAEKWEKAARALQNVSDFLDLE